MTELKTYDMLSSYAISETGNVVELDTNDSVQLTAEDNYKLLTDEQVYLETKGYSIKLWRRFTPDDIIKMWNSPKAKPIQLSKSVPPVQTKECTTQKSVPLKEENCTSVPKGVVQINGVVYQSIRDASAQLSIHRNTIKKRLDDDSNKDYSYLED